MSSSHLAYYDWFDVNRTEPDIEYGPWPLWNALTNHSYAIHFKKQFAKNTTLEQESQPATLGFFTGSLLILALSSQTIISKKGFDISIRHIFDQLLSLAAAILLVPITIVTLLSLAAYKWIVQAYLGRELLHAADAVWALDAVEPESLSVINILSILSGPMSLEELRTIVLTRILRTSNKLTSLRKYSTLGYFYWEPKALDVNCVVRVLEGCSEEEEVSELELQARLAATSNTPLPQAHQAGWEVLLGPRLTGGRTAIVFRVHHTMGDGPSLLRLLLGALADESLGVPANIEEVAQRAIKTLRNGQRQSALEMVREGVAGLAAQAAIPPDTGLLHSRPLQGSKQLVWRSSETLLRAAQDVRRATGAPFTAGLLAALATALAEYSEARGVPPVPLTIVLPARTPGQLASTELDNGFSMFLVRVPALPPRLCAETRVRAAAASLRAACRPAVLLANSWALRVAGSLMPRPLASRLMYSRQCTAVLSNLPGPQHPIRVAGRTMQQLAFWVPNRGTTGVGASVLSYAGRLSLGLAVDEALLARPEDADLLAAAWEKHLLRLAQLLGPPSPSAHNQY